MKATILLVLTASAALAAPCLQPVEACSERLAVGKGHVTVYRTHPLAAASAPEVRLAYIMVHGTNRNASEYFAWTLASTAAAARLDSTAVAAPHFKARTSTGGDAVNEGELYWTNEGWKSGEAASNGSEFSYDAMNAIVRAFADRTRFPNLEEIVVAGHSAGGQYVQRYAATNLIDPIANIKIRYVVANPSSYVYMNELRLSPGGACSEEGGCTGRFIPYSDARNCTTYDQYRYGLDRLTGFASIAGASRIRTQFPARRVYYLVGELDTNVNDPSLDKSCPAQSQGPNRRERGVNFWNHVTQLLSANHKLGIAPGCGHSAVCVFAGPAGVKAVFSPFE
ncbi:MAG: alpha/beta fold hydrolase [Bryobacteraceae bacterium]|nr:alpha/beta fold hydrolase [Bryobacteraceae bacterium]